MSLGLSLQVQGIEKLWKALEELGDELTEELGVALKSEAERVMNVAVARAPLGETGKLRKNVAVLPLKHTAKEISTGFVFRESYAHTQHENIGFAHKDGRSKYAESALKDEAGNIIQALIRAGRKKVG